MLTMDHGKGAGLTDSPRPCMATLLDDVPLTFKSVCSSRGAPLGVKMKISVQEDAAVIVPLFVHVPPTLVKSRESPVVTV
jgi:hypothetical protein